MRIYKHHTPVMMNHFNVASQSMDQVKRCQSVPVKVVAEVCRKDTLLLMKNGQMSLRCVAVYVLHEAFDTDCIY